MAKQLTGTVTSTKMTKTIIILVERKFSHPRFKKIIKKHDKFKAHNEDPSIKVGDVVTIVETRPISKEKHFIVAGQKVTVQSAPIIAKTQPKPKKAEVKKTPVKKITKK